jgi:choline dehydrogenase-like flavoprotein
VVGAKYMVADECSYNFSGGGTSGCVVAGRLAEDTNASILVVEAGPDSKDNENGKQTRP